MRHGAHHRLQIPVQEVPQPRRVRGVPRALGGGNGAVANGLAKQTISLDPKDHDFFVHKEAGSSPWSSNRGPRRRARRRLSPTTRAPAARARSTRSAAAEARRRVRVRGHHFACILSLLTERAARGCRAVVSRLVSSIVCSCPSPLTPDERAGLVVLVQVVKVYDSRLERLSPSRRTRVRRSSAAAEASRAA